MNLSPILFIIPKELWISGEIFLEKWGDDSIKFNLKNAGCQFFNIFTLIFFFLSSSAIAQPTITLTTADNQAYSRSMAMNAVLTECFKRMKIELVIISMPSKRALLNADNGTEDGNFVRTDGISKLYTNLVKVPEKLTENPIVAFSKNMDIKIKGWKSLLNYHVVYVNGWRNCERKLKDVKGKTIVKNEELLFTLLEKDRADVGVFGYHTGMNLLKIRKNTEIKALSPPIVVSALFLYLHKTHAALIPEIVKNIKAMKNDGTYERLLADVL